jgi:hypothetical protein
MTLWEMAKAVLHFNGGKLRDDTSLLLLHYG